MRVIAGLAGGIRLVVPETNVRPTMDRVKAAIFSSLGEQIIGARVLDLFAGTGALGLEALTCECYRMLSRAGSAHLPSIGATMRDGPHRDVAPSSGPVTTHAADTTRSSPHR